MNYADNFSKFFEKVKELMPSLRNVRLHLDNTEPIHADQFHYEKFNELVELPNVKAIVLEIGCLYSDHFNKYGTKSELRELAEAIRARLVKVRTGGYYTPEESVDFRRHIWLAKCLGLPSAYITFGLELQLTPLVDSHRACCEAGKSRADYSYRNCRKRC